LVDHSFESVEQLKRTGVSAIDSGLLVTSRSMVSMAESFSADCVAVGQGLECTVISATFFSTFGT
jgi:hypothetical protein